MANKNQKQIRKAQRKEVRQANKGSRKSRAERKVIRKTKRTLSMEEAKSLGLAPVVYNVLRQELSHEDIKHALEGQNHLENPLARVE